MLSGDQLGSIHPLDKSRMLLGRDPSADLQIVDEGVSRRHATLQWTQDLCCFVLADLGSSNGTYVNDQRLSAPRILAKGDKIRLGKSTVLRLAFANELEARFARAMYSTALRDPLTGVFNRRYLEHRIESEVRSARRDASSLCLIMLDLDHFKRVNDTYGHPAGDDLLRQFTQLLHPLLRDEDTLARYGGEEFVVLCREIDLDAVSLLAARIREAVEAHPFCLGDATIRVTVSAGIVAYGPSTTDLLASADRALYAAKARGRNCVVRSDEV